MQAAVEENRTLVDRFGRRIDYLRISITDRCNFRCVYCMPEEGFPATPKAEHLTFEELVRLSRIAVEAGIRKIRLTGGEPLLRKDLPDLIRNIAALGFDDLSCTTNGFDLAEKAQPLHQAGLHRLNVSLDTLRPERFQRIARRGNLQSVLEGISAAQLVGLSPLKINCVTMKGINDDEAEDFAELTLRQPLHVRFIELMPMRWNLDETGGEFESFTPHGGKGLLSLRVAAGSMLSDNEMRKLFVSSGETRARIEQRFGTLVDADVQTNGPARSCRIAGAKGTVGFISQISNDFCVRCNRLRLTHDGFLRPCLMSDGELDMRTPMRLGASDSHLLALLEHVVEHKPERHYLAEGQRVIGRGMSQIGG